MPLVTEEYIVKVDVDCEQNQNGGMTFVKAIQHIVHVKYAEHKLVKYQKKQSTQISIQLRNVCCWNLFCFYRSVSQDKGLLFLVGMHK